MLIDINYRRRLADKNIYINCKISTTLSNANITVSKVEFSDSEAHINRISQMWDKITGGNSDTGSGSGSESNEEKDHGKFIQLSRYLLMFNLFAF